MERVKLLDAYSLVKLSCSDQSVNLCNNSWPSVMNNIFHTFSSALSLKPNLEQIYSDCWSSFINSCQSQGKLKVYSSIKKSFELENYLLQFPIHIRRNLTKLRISAHSLAIETGRYSKPNKTPIEKRICYYCKEVETEFHFIFKCSLYNAERNLLYNDLSNVLSIQISPSEDLFNILLSGLHGDLEVGKIICTYINESFSIRSEILSNKRENDILQRTKLEVTRSGRISRPPTILDL